MAENNFFCHLHITFEIFRLHNKAFSIHNEDGYITSRLSQSFRLRVLDLSTVLYALVLPIEKQSNVRSEETINKCCSYWMAVFSI
jgi:hypothetical protein